MNPILILRFGAGLCFIGHGILALAAKAKFIFLLSTFGIEADAAVLILRLIGGVDILVGFFILIKPTKLVLKWATIWTSLTIIAWFIHGDTVMDLMRRAPYFTTPFALLALLYGRNLTTIKMEGSPEAASINGEAAIDKIDLSKVCMKLKESEDGEGWSADQCAEVAQEYRRYLKLNLLYPNETIVPNLAIDTMWHYHILDTEAYERDCKAIFGKMLHHYPYFGLEGKADAKNFVNAFDQTKKLYKKTFSTVMGGPHYLPSFQS